MDANNPKVQEWEELMRKYQKALPFAKKNALPVIVIKINRLGIASAWSLT